MAFLSIGANTYSVQTQNAQETAATYVGEKVRSFNNTLRSTRRTKKRQWSFVLGPMAKAAYDTLLTALANDTVVNISGSAVNGASIAVMGDAVGQYIPDGVNFQMTATVTLDEV